MRLSAGPARSTALLSLPLAVLTASLGGREPAGAPPARGQSPAPRPAGAPHPVPDRRRRRSPLGLFLVVGLLRLAAADPSHYLLGRLHGPRLTELALRRPGPHRSLRFLLRAWQHIGLPLVALSPTGKVLVMAGASGLRHRRVAAVALGGTLVQLLALYAAGRAVSGRWRPWRLWHPTTPPPSCSSPRWPRSPSPSWAGPLSTGQGFGRYRAPTKRPAVGFEHPRRALGHGGVVAEVEAVLPLQAGEEVLDDVAVGAEHRDRARRPAGQGEDVAGRAALGQGGIDLHRQAAVAGQVDDGLQAAHVPAGQDALDGKPGQHVDQGGGLAPALAGQRPPVVRALPLLAVAGVGVADDQQRDRHRGRPPGWNDFSTRRSRS